MDVSSCGLCEHACSYVELVKSAVDPKKAGRGLYFSSGIQLTLTTERQARVINERGEGSWELEDTRFFWNRYLMEPITRDAHLFGKRLLMSAMQS